MGSERRLCVNGNVGMMGWGCDVVMHETYYWGGFKPVKKKAHLQPRAHVKREIMGN